MVRVEGIKKVFKKGTIDEKVAIADISLHCKKGDFITVIGSNGAGKTTLLNLIAGTFIPDEGEVFIDGTKVTRLPEYRRSIYLGRIFQN
ncbi:MAG: ATP-binding cassette domain-containing protein, partial [Proteobacteria bacterium]|nr:ATP-binding cassette domain-containing protein [Pseudomonadota bacterium]